MNCAHAQFMNSILTITYRHSSGYYKVKFLACSIKLIDFLLDPD